jgi:uncharacterized protein YaiL (DUF2058 family)
MSDSLRDQLLGLGFKSAPKPETRPGRQAEPGKRRHAAPGDPRTRHTKDAPPRKGAAGRPATGGRGAPGGEEFDLARAYALRGEHERREREAAEKARQEEAQKRRVARAALEALLKDQALNAADAEQVRHFSYGGKIKRVHVTAEQLRALNAGELGVVQHNGRYLLVSAAVLAQAKAVFPAAVALEVDPGAPSDEDPYGDPAYRVPDDLMW